MRIELSEEQLEIIKAVRDGHNVYIDACIGSGKTTLLDAISKRNFRKKILYLTYNKLLKEDAKKKITLGNVEVQNYHGFVYRYLTSHGYRYSHVDGIKNFIHLVNNNKIRVPQYDLILIDEYQDINDATKDLILTIDAHQETPPQLVFVGDMKQKIYDTTTIDVLDDCIFKLRDDYVKLDLTQCFRLNPEHASMLGTIWEKPIKGVNYEQGISRMEFSKYDILGKLNEYPNKDILILSPFRNNVKVNELINYIEKTNPTKYNKTNLYVTIQDGRGDTNRPVKDSMIVTTFDGAKGMERKLTLVFGFDGSALLSRSSKADPQIVTNLFLVAASRGKSEIILIEAENTKTLNEVNFHDYISERVPVNNYSVSSMFDFAFDTDIKKSMSYLTIEEIPTEDKSEIKAIHNDYNILLSPSIGVYQEAVFFDDWDFEKAMQHYDQEDPVIKYIRKTRPRDLKSQVLAITAADTGLVRYINQAIDEFIDANNEVKLKNRLAARLNPTDINQEFTSIDFRDVSIRGLIDVINQETPYELKFVSTLEHKHYLQIAMYVAMTDVEYGYLWNTRFNQLYRVSIRDRRAFINQVLKTITKGDYYGK